MERDLLISLVTRAQKGDSTAMDELFANFYNDVYYFALKTVKDSDTACDITQETFLEIINTIGNLKEPAAFVTWMKQITYHQCTRYFKKKKDVLVEEDEDGNTIFDTLADESEGSIPSEVYEKEEFRNTILSIINELTEEQRSAVMMYYFDELTVAQIAKIQGVSEGTVKSRLNYARKAIKKSVENYEKKHNIKLHSFSFLPLFMLFFVKELMPTAKAAEIGAVVSETASTVATASVAGVGGATAVASAEATVATAGTGIVAKLAAIPLVTKIIAGVVAASIAIGGGVALVSNQANEDDDHQWMDCVDENHDCICDVCSTSIHFTNGERYVGRVAHNAVCDYCGTDLGFYDENMDSICDECGEYPCGDLHKLGHCDGNSDGICDNCSISIESDTVGTEISGHYDRDEFDGLCDHCGIPMCVLGIPTMHWDRDNNCACDECDYVEHFHGQGDACGHCDTCNKVLGILDKDGDGFCDLCGETPCTNIHPHADEDGNGNCDFCGVDSNASVSLSAPQITVEISGEKAVITIAPVEGATSYEMRINGNHMGDYDTTQTSLTISADMLDEGENTVIVCAYIGVVYSPDSNTVIVGKLANPQYHATGTGVDLPWGDVENAQGYIIYDENGEYLATMGLGGTYDFSNLYTEDGFYFPYIQAYADGWISSEKCGIPVSIGSNGGPIGSDE